eukprot:5482718-Amphidinium_carterae.1
MPTTDSKLRHRLVEPGQSWTADKHCYKDYMVEVGRPRLDLKASICLRISAASCSSSCQTTNSCQSLVEERENLNRSSRALKRIQGTDTNKHYTSLPALIVQQGTRARA